ncbi:MAG: ribulose-phosphate 3-epimerase [Actinomycetota bacterium]
MGTLSASILSADLARLAEQVKLVQEHADVIHVDLMDAHFVPPLTIGPVVVASIRPHTERTLHGHLLVEAPEAMLEDLAEAGTDMVSFHLEAVPDPAPVIAKVRGAGLGVGIALGPETPVAAVEPYLEDVDEVTVMSVHPARAGEGFLPGALGWIEAVRRELDGRDLVGDVAVEGALTRDDARRCVDAGASVLVAGAAIFGAADVAEAARSLKAIVGAA